MAKAAMYIQIGDTIDWKNPGSDESADVAVGDVIPLTSIIGVALEDIAHGATGSVKVTGVFEMPADGTSAFAVGDALYWDATDGQLTKTETSNTPAGWCVEPKATAGTTAKVKIG